MLNNLILTIENRVRVREQLAWTNTEASDDADHTADTDVAHEWQLSLQGDEPWRTNEYPALFIFMGIIISAGLQWNESRQFQVKETDVRGYASPR